MVKLLIGTLLILVANISFAIKLDARTKAIDSSVLIVLDDKVLGTIREIKDLINIISPDSISSINILKDTAAFTKYGDKGKNGVIEIYTTKAAKSQVKDLHLEEIKEDDDKIFVKVEVEASFPGGQRAWKNYLSKNLDVNVPVKNGCKPGEYTVVIQFIVEKDGSVSDVRALTNHAFGMEEEAVRVMRLSSKWNAAMQNQKKVTAYRLQPRTEPADPQTPVLAQLTHDEIGDVRRDRETETDRAG